MRVVLFVVLLVVTGGLPASGQGFTNTDTTTLSGCLKKAGNLLKLLYSCKKLLPQACR